MKKVEPNNKYAADNNQVDGGETFASEDVKKGKSDGLSISSW